VPAPPLRERSHPAIGLPAGAGFPQTGSLYWPRRPAELRPSFVPSAILGSVTRQDDVEVIREAFERWNRRDLDYWIHLAHPQVEIWSKYAALDADDEPYRGHDGLRAWRAEIDRNFELHHVLANDIRAVGDRVLVLGAVRLRGKASGTEMEHPFAWVCEMRDGALSRMLFYSSHAEALEEVGLRE
jgi:ketosteroid isomerase-like protein